MIKLAHGTEKSFQYGNVTYINRGPEIVNGKQTGQFLYSPATTKELFSWDIGTHNLTCTWTPKAPNPKTQNETTVTFSGVQRYMNYGTLTIPDPTPAIREFIYDTLASASPLLIFTNDFSEKGRVVSQRGANTATDPIELTIDSLADKLKTQLSKIVGLGTPTSNGIDTQIINYSDVTVLGNMEMAYFTTTLTKEQAGSIAVCLAKNNRSFLQFKSDHSTYSIFQLISTFNSPNYGLVVMYTGDSKPPANSPVEFGCEQLGAARPRLLQ